MTPTKLTKLPPIDAVSVDSSPARKVAPAESTGPRVDALQRLAERVRRDAESEPQRYLSRVDVGHDGE